MSNSLLQSFLLASLFADSAATLAQGYYEYISYYDNNPFLFCTEGVPQDCRVPVNPTTGTYTVTDEECFIQASASLYARVCPLAFQQLGVALPNRNELTQKAS